MSFFLVITGCGRTIVKIDSNKEPDFSGKISKLYILIKQTDNAKPFLYPFITRFETYLTSKNIAFQEYYLEQLSLETDENVQKRIDAYGPNTVMIVSQDQSRITHSYSNNGFAGSGGYNSVGFGGNAGNMRRITGGTFDIKLFIPKSKNPVWRASLRADSPKGIKRAVTEATEKFINKLIADNLLEGPLLIPNN